MTDAYLSDLQKNGKQSDSSSSSSSSSDDEKKKPKKPRYVPTVPMPINMGSTPRKGQQSLLRAGTILHRSHAASYCSHDH